MRGDALLVLAVNVRAALSNMVQGEGTSGRTRVVLASAPWWWWYDTGVRVKVRRVTALIS